MYKYKRTKLKNHETTSNKTHTSTLRTDKQNNSHIDIKLNIYYQILVIRNKYHISPDYHIRIFYKNLQQVFSQTNKSMPIIGDKPPTDLCQILATTKIKTRDQHIHESTCRNNNTITIVNNKR